MNRREEQEALIFCERKKEEIGEVVVSPNKTLCASRRTLGQEIHCVRSSWQR